jgi:acetone carboxylase gamma subunit
MSRISPTLVANKGKICCAQCRHPLSNTGTSWKKGAAISAIPFHGLPGASAGLHSGVVLRQFSCPKCLRLLDTETALPDDPFLEDIVAI